MLMGARPVPPTPYTLEAPGGVFLGVKNIEASPHATEGFGYFFGASIISTIEPSFLIFGHLNISRVLEGS